MSTPSVVAKSHIVVNPRRSVVWVDVILDERYPLSVAVLAGRTNSGHLFVQPLRSKITGESLGTVWLPDELYVMVRSAVRDYLEGQSS